jgi:hypothetical protein
MTPPPVMPRSRLLAGTGADHLAISRRLPAFTLARIGRNSRLVTLGQLTIPHSVATAQPRGLGPVTE